MSNHTTVSPYRVVNSTPDMAEQLEAIQRACFPSLDEDLLITAAHYRSHIKRFPEGQHAVLDVEGVAVACSTDLRVRVDFDHYEHTYMEATGDNWLSTHDPEGDWLYGADIGVLPRCRRQGLGTLLYRARHDLIRRLNLRGHVAGSMPTGYAGHRDQLTIEQYIQEVVAGRLFDPTLSVQLRRGFVVHGIIPGYVEDPSCDNCAAFIVWHNPDYQPEHI